MMPIGNELGRGVYYRAEAARLLGITPSRLGRWVRGYTYYSEGLPAMAHEQSPVLKSKSKDQPSAISFLDLMELRVVKSLVDIHGVPLQRVRKAAEFASRQFNTKYPFASRRIFTDGRSIFSALAQEPSDNPDLIELIRDRHLQVIAGDIIGPFLEEMDFDPRTRLVSRWWPLGRSAPVVLDPRIEFGAPTIEGTRVQTTVIAGLAERESTSIAAAAYRLSAREVRAAIRFESHLKAA